MLRISESFKKSHIATWIITIIITIITITIIITIIITRVTDKKHHVTDVIAGGCLGGLFAVVALTAFADKRCAKYHDFEDDDYDHGHDNWEMKS